MSFRILDWNYAFHSNVALTASSADAYFPVSNLKNFLRSKVWRTTGVTNESVVIDLHTTEAIDTIVVFPHSLDGSKFSSSAVLTIEANPTNLWTSPALTQVLSYDEDHEVWSYLWSTDQSYRYWRLKITDPTNLLGYLEISKIVITKATIPSQCPEPGFAYKNDDKSKNTSTDYGQVYSDVMPNVRSMEFNFPLLTYADYETLQSLYDRVGSTVPIVTILDDAENIFDKDRMLMYGLMESTFDAKHRVFNYFDQPFKIRELL